MLLSLGFIITCSFVIAFSLEQHLENSVEDLPDASDIQYVDKESENSTSPIDLKTLDGSKVVGGSTAFAGQFPYLVSIQDLGGHFCGGSILSAYWVITAAHCVSGETPTKIRVFTNTTNQYYGQIYSIAKIIIHPMYNSITITADIALLQMQYPIKFDRWLVRPISLSRKLYGSGWPLIISGWGKTSHPGTDPKFTQFVELKSISNSECKSRFTSSIASGINNGAICTISALNKGICFGDSGGPLTTKDGSVLVGLASWVIPCAKGYPDVFTRISYYYNWIKHYTG